MKGEGWLYLIGGVLVASLLFHAPLLFIVSLILLLVAATVRIWDRYCLVGLSYKRELGQTRAFFGEEVPFVVEITNDKPLPLAWLEVDDTVFGPATLRTGDVFGFASQEMDLLQEDYLLVYPRIVTLTQLGLPPHDPFGEVPLQRQWLFEDPLRTVGVRDYRPGDSPRRLHWKATARAPDQQLQVKLLEPTTTYRLMVLLNVSTFAENWAWQGYDPEVLEAAITIAASVANWGAEQGYQIGLSANAKAYRSRAALRMLPSRDPRQLMHVLEALATLVPMATMGPGDLVELEGRDLAYGTTVVMVSATADSALLRQLARLRQAGHRPALLLIGDATGWSTLDGIPVRRVRVEDAR